MHSVTYVRHRLRETDCGPTCIQQWDCWAGCIGRENEQ
nr:MAG TPA: Integrin alpha-V, Integrin beta-3 DOMAIN, PSI, EGF REPEATS [Caudoviricetes sp.]